MFRMKSHLPTRNERICVTMMGAYLWSLLSPFPTVLFVNSDLSPSVINTTSICIVLLCTYDKPQLVFDENSSLAHKICQVKVFLSFVILGCLILILRYDRFS